MLTVWDNRGTALLVFPGQRKSLFGYGLTEAMKLLKQSCLELILQAAPDSQTYMRGVHVPLNQVSADTSCSDRMFHSETHTIPREN